MKWLVAILILLLVLIAGCTQQPTGQALVRQAKYTCLDGSAVDNPNLCSNITKPELTNSTCDANCTGSASPCEEYVCVERNCTIMKLPDCCGNGVCEPNEIQDLYIRCPADCQTIVQEINHTSCAESGKIKVLVIGLVGSNPPYTDNTLNILNESTIGYPVELTIKRFEGLDAVEANNPLLREYSITGFPSIIVNCHLLFTGQRTVDNFKTLFADLLKAGK